MKTISKLPVTNTVLKNNAYCYNLSVPLLMRQHAHKTSINPAIKDSNTGQYNNRVSLLHRQYSTQQKQPLSDFFVLKNKFSSFKNTQYASTRFYSNNSSKKNEKIIFDEKQIAEMNRTEFKDTLKPQQVVDELNRYIVGQNEAKRAVAIAMRNRWRRQQLPENIREEVLPKNILMIGPTGVGKTEVARRMAKLCDAPFIKVEATKFTEVGFHGRDVDQIIRDLVDIAIQQTKVNLKNKLKDHAASAVEERILDKLVGKGDCANRENFKMMLRNGQLEDREIEIEVDTKSRRPIIQPVGGTPMQGQEEYMNVLGSVFDVLSPNKSKKQKLKIESCRKVLEEQELEKLINMDLVIKEALRAVEQESIVFIDEIDKVCTKSKEEGHDASAEGVQRDLLPIVEGTTVNTRYGNVQTDHILFIASGAFHSVKPSDMLAELQGRLPIRVELKGLTEQDLYRILTEPENNLLYQNIELLKTEGVFLKFSESCVKEIAKVAAEINSTIENIGARRLITVIEKLLEDISFSAPDRSGETITLEDEDVRKNLGSLMKKSDLSKFVL